METPVKKRSKNAGDAASRESWKQWEEVVVLAVLSIVPIWAMLFVHDPGGRFWVGHIIWSSCASVLPLRYFRRGEHQLWAGFLTVAGWVMLVIWAVIAADSIIAGR